MLTQISEKTSASATLVITPSEACWVLEQQKKGMVQSAVVLPPKSEFNKLKDYDTFKKLVDDNKGFARLRIQNGFPDMTTSTVVSRNRG